MNKLNDFYCKYRLLIFNIFMFFGLICIFIVPKTYWIHDNGFWVGFSSVVMLYNIVEIIKRVKYRNAAKKQVA